MTEEKYGCGDGRGVWVVQVVERWWEEHGGENQKLIETEWMEKKHSLYPAAAKESPNENQGIYESRGSDKENRERNAMKNGELSGELWRGSWALSVLPWPQRIYVCEHAHKDTWPWSSCSPTYILYALTYLYYMQTCTHIHRCNITTWFTYKKCPEAERRLVFCFFFALAFNVPELSQLSSCQTHSPWRPTRAPIVSGIRACSSEAA